MINLRSDFVEDKKTGVLPMKHIPRTIMNDYTKNISTSIFTPGVVQDKDETP